MTGGADLDGSLKEWEGFLAAALGREREGAAVYRLRRRRIQFHSQQKLSFAFGVQTGFKGGDGHAEVSIGRILRQLHRFSALLDGGPVGALFGVERAQFQIVVEFFGSKLNGFLKCHGSLVEAIAFLKNQAQLSPRIAVLWIELNRAR